MDPTTILLAFVIASVALTAPFGLKFDQAGLGDPPSAVRGRQVLFAVMALLFGTGFVALAAAGAGVLLGIDEIAAMMPLAWVWAPILLLATVAALRRPG
jgi:hypothetical protein